MLNGSAPDSEFCPPFVDAMRARMAVSFHKYGALVDAYPHRVDALLSLRTRLFLYEHGDAAKGIKPGNTEYLVDLANFAMIEFMLPRHPKAHFHGTDESGSPGRVAARTGKADHRGNADVGMGPVPSAVREYR